MRRQRHVAMLIRPRVSLRCCWIAEISILKSLVSSIGLRIHWQLLLLLGEKLRWNCRRLCCKKDFSFLGRIFFAFLQWFDAWALRPLTPVGTLELLLPGWTRNKNRICPLDKWQSSSNQPPSYIFLSQLLSVAAGGHGLMPKIQETFHVHWRANQGTMMRRIFIRENGLREKTKWVCLNRERFIIKVKLKSVADIFGSITESGSMVTETWAQVDGAEYIRHLFLQWEAAGPQEIWAVMLAVQVFHDYFMVIWESNLPLADLGTFARRGPASTEN